MKSIMKIFSLLAIPAAVISCLPLSVLALSPSLSVTDAYNKHNLSVSGPGTPGITKATTERQVCIFCHTPHHASSVTPLWSRDLSTAVYTPYASTTLKATPKPGQPTGSSRLCLSCHDGTVALGMLTGGKQIDSLPALPAAYRSNLSTDLSDDHPISFLYASSLTPGSGLAQPWQFPPAVTLENGRLECTSCHNPHMDLYPSKIDPVKSGYFLVLDNSARSALCVACHITPGLTASAHYLQGDPCDNCHISHRAPQPARLLQGANLQQTCLLNCHNGSTPLDQKGSDIKSTFTTAKTHQTGLVVLSGSHDANENPLTYNPKSPHVECVDCHNPCLTTHVTIPLSSPPQINGRLASVTIAVAADGTRTFATKEYEVCYKCHSALSFTPAVVPRQIRTGDESLRFSSDNPSFHPVMASGKASIVPSLRAEIVGFNPARTLTTSSQLYCTDCHTSNNSSKVGGSGATGPHGSAYSHLLMDQYELDTYPLPYADSNYALCYRCHDQNVLLDPARSSFPPHQSHLVTHQVPCSVCHDPHGVSLVLGATVAGNAHLINFDTRFVNPTTPVPAYNSMARSCTVSCHSSNPRTY